MYLTVWVTEVGRYRGIKNRLVGNILAREARGLELRLQNIHEKSQVWRVLAILGLGRQRQADPGGSLAG